MSARKQSRKSRRGKARRSQSMKSGVSNSQRLQTLFNWFLPNEQIFAGLGLHGNTKWTPKALVWLAICWSWVESQHVTTAFETALDQCRALGITPLETYQGLMEALATWTDRLMKLLWPVLHQHMQQIGGPFWKIGGWIPVAFDGARSSAPRTKSNEQVLCAANYGFGMTAKYRKKKTKGMRRRKNEKNKAQPQEPQAWITLLWHMGLRLPWMWRLGPSNSSERAHVMEMIIAKDFPENTLFCGDAGFVGYPLWSHILSCGYHFLVRVGANVHLLSEVVDCQIGKGGSVLCWPDDAMRSGLPPLKLRLVRVRIGSQWMWMLTSVLTPSLLKTSQIVEFYQMRWGVELEFRGLKQTLDRHKLRCRNPRRLLAELNWSIMAMTVAELFALKEQLKPPRQNSAAGRLAGPTKRSLANTIRALRWSLSHPSEIPESGQDLYSRLQSAVTDNYVRKSSKKARYRPPNPDKKPLGHPKIRKPNKQQKEQLRLLMPIKIAA